MDKDGRPRIEVFNPCDDTDDQKTTTAILFDNNYKFIDFGSSALQKYAEILDDGGNALLFQSVRILNFDSLFNNSVFSTKCTFITCTPVQDRLMVEKFH